jgi:optic atrophy 3 protein
VSIDLANIIKNQIKAQAREHERFRRFFVSVAQALHRFDMRMRLGLLRDSAALERRAAKDAAEAEVKKHQSAIPTVKTEAQTKAEEVAMVKAKEKAHESAKQAPLPRIRPLSEAKAIDSGANFISETFLFAVAGCLIVFESWRSRRKETSRREDVQDQLNELAQSEKATRLALADLEKELLELKGKDAKSGSKATKQVFTGQVREEVTQERDTEAPKNKSWLSRVSSLQLFRKAAERPVSNAQTQGTNNLNSSLTKSSPHLVTPAAPNLSQSSS